MLVSGKKVKLGERKGGAGSYHFVECREGCHSIKKRHEKFERFLLKQSACGYWKESELKAREKKSSIEHNENG